MSASEHSLVRVSHESGIPQEYITLVEHSIGWLADRHLTNVDQLKIHLTTELEAEGYQISRKFLHQLEERNLNYSEVLSQKEPVILSESGAPDLISTIVYMINYLQEYGDHQSDALGRFRYEDSYQKAFNCAEKNLVLSYFKALMIELEMDIDTFVHTKSKLFVSHDVDTMFRGFWQDGFNALKKGRIDLLFSLLVREISGKPVWFNLDRVMDVTDRFGVKSTFFWLATNKKETIAGNRMWNADYRINSKKIKSIISQIKKRGFELGLHKSISATSFESEMAQLPFETSVNRNHFLRLSIPQHLTQMDEANILQDFSLGFAEHFGFRNSYALPYRPFNLESGKPTTCLFTPLAIMETTNWTYMKLPLHEMKSHLLDFVNEHQYDALISVLWHNNHFSEIKFKGYTEVYEAVLNQCRQNGIKSLNQQEVMDQFG
ncbi:MAG: polysaccharide deacetylase family protein [Salibacteraceae bacterium]